MKRIKIVMASIIALSLAGCSTASGPGPDNGSWARWTSFKTMWSGNQAQGQSVTANGQSGYYPKAYKAPRKYYITKQDQQSYQNMNNKIEQRSQSNSPGTVPASGGGGMMMPQQNSPANTTTQQAPATSTVPFPAPQQ